MSPGQPRRVPEVPLESDGPACIGPTRRQPGAGMPPPQSPGAPPERGRRPVALWLGLAVAGIGLGVLAFAEARWLHHMPADTVARQSVAIIRGDGADLEPSAIDRAQQVARGDDVLAAVSARTRSGTAAPVAVATLRQELSVQESCIQVMPPGEKPHGGLLVTATFRGSTQGVRAQAAAWESAFEARIGALEARWRASDVGALRYPYQRCEVK